MQFWWSLYCSFLPLLNLPVFPFSCFYSYQPCSISQCSYYIWIRSSPLSSSQTCPDSIQQTCFSELFPGSSDHVHCVLCSFTTALKLVEIKKYKLLFQRCTKRWPRVWDHSNSYQLSLLVLIGPVLGHFWLLLVFMGHCSSSCNITLSLHSQISQLPYYLCVIQHLPQVLQSFADNSLLVVTSGSLDGPNSINKQPAKTERDKQTERERWAPQLWCELVCWWSFSGRPQ